MNSYAFIVGIQLENVVIICSFAFTPIRTSSSMEILIRLSNNVLSFDCPTANNEIRMAVLLNLNIKIDSSLGKENSYLTINFHLPDSYSQGDFIFPIRFLLPSPTLPPLLPEVCFSALIIHTLLVVCSINQNGKCWKCKFLFGECSRWRCGGFIAVFIFFFPSFLQWLLNGRTAIW